jgi:hypothetical protein
MDTHVSIYGHKGGSMDTLLDLDGAISLVWMGLRG